MYDRAVVFFIFRIHAKQAPLPFLPGSFQTKGREGRNHRQNVGRRFSIINSRDSEEDRKNQSEGDEKDDFSQECQKQGNQGLPQDHENVLAGHLDAEDGHSQEEYPEISRRNFQKLRVLIEYNRKDFGKRINI